MKTIKQIIYLMTGIVAFSLTGCSDDNSYEPGPQTAPGCMQVYFLKSNEVSKVINNDEEHAVTLKVGRVQTTAAASVPITVISQDKVFTIPQSVEFGAGQEFASIKIAFSGADIATKYSYSIAIDGKEFVDPYTKLDGSSKFFGSAMLVSWDVAIQNATFKFTSGFSSFQQDILKMTGTNRYKIENYLNSGADLIFTLDETSNLLTPLGGYSSNATSWYFYNNDTEKIPIPCFPAGSELSINSFYLYLGASYTYLNLKTKKGRLYHYNFLSDDSKGYNAIDISW